MTDPFAGIDPMQLERQVCFALAVASREVVSLYRPLLEPLGLTHPQYLVMVALWENDVSLSVKQLTRLLKLEAPTLSPLLKRLEVAGLVERQRDPADERSLLVTLTDRGRALREPAARVPSTIVAQLGMTLPELKALQDVLSQVIARAKAQEARPGDPVPPLAPPA